MGFDDVQGWQSTRWGMTADEIVNSVGHEHLRRRPRADYTRMYANLVIEAVTIGREHYDVIFQMSKETDRLSQVLLQHQCHDNRRFPSDVMNRAKQMLTERFGEAERIGAEEAFIWRFPTTEIELDALFIEDIASSVSVTFRPSSAPSRRPPVAF